MAVTPDRNLALELVRVTEAAALGAGRWIGRGDKEAADQAAVDAMRAMLDTVAMDGVVVIGEGEKDEAPMLFNGEEVGNGQPPQVDVAVDPLEGTRLTSVGQPNAIAVIAVGERGSMLFPGAAVYMDKIAVGPAASRVWQVAHDWRPFHPSLKIVLPLSRLPPLETPGPLVPPQAARTRRIAPMTESRARNTGEP